jgi:hypothetical protein
VLASQFRYWASHALVPLVLLEEVALVTVLARIGGLNPPLSRELAQDLVAQVREGLVSGPRMLYSSRRLSGLVRASIACWLTVARELAQGRVAVYGVCGLTLLVYEAVSY